MHSSVSLIFVLSIFCLTYGAPDISNFRVDSLPDGPSLPPSWAGRLPVPHAEPDNALFFWLFQAEDTAHDDDLIIWFNGGPGCSSLIGLTTGSGPFVFEGNSTHVVANPYSWTKLGHVLYIDQPVGTGYSTASQPYPAVDNDAVTTHFYDWLQSFFGHFPHLQSKRVHLMGESWAGMYIPYFASAIVDNQDSFPIRLRSMTIGDGSIGNPAAMASVAIGQYLESQQDLLHLPEDIREIFQEASVECGFDGVLQQAAQFPPEGIISIPGNPESLNYKQRKRRNLGDINQGICSIHPVKPEEVRLSIHSSCYGPCASHSTALDLLATTSFYGVDKPCFDVYDISHDCSTINHFSLVASYFNRADVQIALNLLPSASTSPSASNDDTDANSDTLPPPSPSPFTFCNTDIMNLLLDSQPAQPPAYSILPTLVTSHNISLHIYSGEYDMLINHYGTELVLQNMTWNGAQGFSRPISRPFYQDNAAPFNSHPASNGSSHGQNKPSNRQVCPIPEAGKWSSERGVTYHLFWRAGHSVFLSKPREMFAYVRDVVVAS
ncbi:Alpha/Beta hydrolase protein [Aspergillus crustosus]